MVDLTSPLDVFQKEIADEARQSSSKRNFAGTHSSMSATFSEVKVLFEDANLYVRQLSDTKHAVICPFADGHTSTNQTDSSTVLFDFETGPGFKCFHNHCVDKNIGDVMCFFGVTSPRQDYSTDGQWDEIKPLPSVLSVPPALLAEMIPAEIRTWCVERAEGIGVALECIVLPLISSLAATIGTKIVVAPKKNDLKWQVAPSVLWSLVVARPGSKKTPALSAATSFVRDIENEEREKFEAAEYERSVYQTILKSRIKKVEDDINKHTRGKSPPLTTLDELKADLSELNRQLKEASKPHPRYIVNDTTTEKLAELLKENPNGLLLFVDEVTGWFRSFEKQGHESARAFYLTAWDGMSPITHDRISRATTHVPRMFIVTTGGIQPSVLKIYVSAATAGGKGDDGLLQRFQLLAFPDPNVVYKYVDRAMDFDEGEKVTKLFRDLKEMQPMKVCSDEFADFKIPLIQFNDEAQNLFNDFIVRLDERLVADTDLSPALESHLAKNRGTMPALALVFHLLKWASGESVERAIGVDSARLALKWLDFLEAHARTVYEMVTNEKLIAAHALYQKIQNGEVANEMPVREIYRKGWKALSTQSVCSEAIRILEEHNVAVEMEERRNAGRPTKKILIHPKLRASNATDKTDISDLDGPFVGFVSENSPAKESEGELFRVKV